MPSETYKDPVFSGLTVHSSTNFVAQNFGYTDLVSATFFQNHQAMRRMTFCHRESLIASEKLGFVGDMSLLRPCFKNFHMPCYASHASVLPLQSIKKAKSSAAMLKKDRTYLSFLEWRGSRKHHNRLPDWSSRPADTIMTARP